LAEFKVGPQIFPPNVIDKSFDKKSRPETVTSVEYDAELTPPMIADCGIVLLAIFPKKRPVSERSLATKRRPVVDKSLAKKSRALADISPPTTVR
jgi:hypothetical protein